MTIIILGYNDKILILNSLNYEKERSTKRL